jgi:8-oxo-dGTP diphosphatase
MSLQFIDVAAAVIIHRGKVLLARRTDDKLHHLWEFPGGKLEFGETVSQAAQREIDEELSIQVKPQTLLLSLEHKYPEKNVRLHFIKCSLSAQQDKSLTKTRDNPLVTWFYPDEFPLQEFCPADKIAAGKIPWKKILEARNRNERS